MKSRLFGLAAIFGALGTGFCCLAPVVFSVLGVSTVVSLSTLSYVVPYRNVFFGLTLVALALGLWSVIARSGRVSRIEWAILGGSTAVVAILLAYTISIEGLPFPW